MRFLILLLFLPAVELYLSWQIKTALGWDGLFLVLLGAAILGMSIMRRQGIGGLQGLQANLQPGQDPSGVLSSALMSFIGGLFLLIPGPLTDVIGLTLALPWTQRLWRAWFVRKWRHAVQDGRIHAQGFYAAAATRANADPSSPTGAADTLEAEVIEIERREIPQ